MTINLYGGSGGLYGQQASAMNGSLGATLGTANTTNMNALGIAAGNHQAEQTQEALALGDYNRQRGQTQSLRNQLLAMYTNPDAESEATQQASQQKVGAVNRNIATLQDQLTAGGQSLTSGQQASFDKQADLSRNMASLSAKNNAARALTQRQNNIALG